MMPEVRVAAPTPPARATLVAAGLAAAPAPQPEHPRASEHPLLVAVLLTLLPPVGVPLLWASPRFSTAGKITITAFIAFMMTLGTIAFALGRTLCR
jgi:hypothetical protein